MINRKAGATCSSGGQLYLYRTLRYGGYLYPYLKLRISQDSLVQEKVLTQVVQ